MERKVSANSNLVSWRNVMTIPIAEFVRRHELNLRDDYYRTLVRERMRINSRRESGELNQQDRIEIYCGPSPNATTYGYVRNKVRTFGRVLSQLIASESSTDEIIEQVHTFASVVRQSSQLYRRATSRLLDAMASRDIAVCKCDDCGSIVSSDECVSMQSGEQICGACQDDYCSCDSCSELVRLDDCQEIDGDGNYCRHCVERDAYWWESDEAYHFDPEPEEPEFEPETQGDTFRGHPIRTRLDELVTETKGIITSELPNNGIDEVGFNAIVVYLRQHYSMESVDNVIIALRDEQKSRNSDLVEWVTKLGTLPKRIGRILSKLGVKFLPEHSQQVGNIAREHCPKLNAIRWRLIHSHAIDWGRSDYGQNNSCWWHGGCYGNCLPQFQVQPNAYALTIHDGNGKGIGRVWIVILESDCGSTTNAILFNPYGPHSNVILARLIATHLGWHYSATTIDWSCGYVNGTKPQLIGPDFIDGAEVEFTIPWEVPRP